MGIRCKTSVSRTQSKSCLADLAVISSKFLIHLSGVGILSDYRSSQSGLPTNQPKVNVVNRVLTMKLTDFYRYSAVIYRSTLRLKSLRRRKWPKI